MLCLGVRYGEGGARLPGDDGCLLSPRMCMYCANFWVRWGSARVEMAFLVRAIRCVAGVNVKRALTLGFWMGCGAHGKHLSVKRV